MSTAENLRIRLVCRLKNSEEGVGSVLEALDAYGWGIDGSKISREEFEAEVAGASLNEDEVMISVKFSDPEALDGLLKALSQSCWYVDVYYHLRGDLAEKTAKTVGVNPDEKKTVKKREAGVNLRLELFPDARAITVSYRVGWGELNRGVVKKIHAKILGERRERGLLSKVLRWRI